jgi:hypothetical protein
MGQFKPMVKMMTTEPSVELKLKKGGKVSKMADGGFAPMQSSMGSTMPARGGEMPAMRPGKPSMAARRKAMMVSKPVAPMMPAMKKGGSTKHEDEAQDRAMIKKALAGKKFATGGVVEAQGGYKKGGLAASGIIKSEKGKTKMDTAERNDKTSGKTGEVKLDKPAGYKKGGRILGVEGNVTGTPPGVTNMTTGGVKDGNAGGYKKGGNVKKYARGGSVVQDSGKAEKMPQGQKKPSAPVSITALSGTFKRGGKVTKKAAGGLAGDKPTYEAGVEDLSKGAYDKALSDTPTGYGFAKKVHGVIDKVFGVGKGKSETGKKRGGAC